MPDCRTCIWHAPRTWRGREYACQFYIQEPAGCTIYSRQLPADLCRACEHARFNRAGRPFCQIRQPIAEEGCPGYTPRQPGEPLPCPRCNQPLQAEGGKATCPGGHAFALRQGRTPCPRCGEPYATFGIDDAARPEIYRNVYRLCPACNWHEVRQSAYVGPARGRGYGGQRWSPATGRLLARR